MAVLRLVPGIGAPIEVTRDSVAGREAACDVVVEHGSVSRRHALLQQRGLSWFVVDLGSANGTFLDSSRINEAMLRHGQELRLGAVPYRVELVDEAQAEPAATMLTPLAGQPRPAPQPSPPRPAPPVPGRAAPPAPPQPPRAMPPAAPPPPPPRAAGPGAPPLPSRPPSARPPRTEVPPEPAPSGRRRGPIFWIGAGCGGCLLLGGGFLALVVGAAFFMTGGAVDAVKAQLADLRGGRIDAAYGRTSRSYRLRIPQESFAAFVARHPTLKENAGATFWSRSAGNESAAISGMLSSASGARERASFSLVKEEGAWKVSDVVVDGDRAAPGEASSGGMRVQASADKRAETGLTRIVVRLTASGFEVRPQGDRYAIDLALDVETIGPDGQPVEALSRQDVERYRATTTMAKGAVAPTTTSLTLDPATAAPGTYTVRLTVRDLVGGGQGTQELSFEMP